MKIGGGVAVGIEGGGVVVGIEGGGEVPVGSGEMSIGMGSWGGQSPAVIWVVSLECGRCVECGTEGRFCGWHLEISRRTANWQVNSFTTAAQPLMSQHCTIP